MDFTGAWNGIKDWISAYAGTPPTLIWLALASAVYLFIVHKSLRARLLIPLLVLVPVIINPILYHYVYFNLRYWRFFWLLQQGMLIGYAVIDIALRFRRSWVRCLCLVLAAAALVAGGKNVLWLDEGTKHVTDTKNPYKLTATHIAVCDAILADNSHPFCIVDGTIRYEARQYSADIRLMWGNVLSLYSNPGALEVYNHMYAEPRDWEYVFSYAGDHEEITHVVYRAKDGEKIKNIKAIAKKNGFKALEKIGKYTIFKRSGSKKKN